MCIYFFGQDSSDKVGFFRSCDCQYQVGLVDIGLLEDVNGGGVVVQGYNIEVGGCIVEYFLIGVNEDDILFFKGQQFGQVEIYVVGFCDYNFYDQNFLKLRVVVCIMSFFKL